jgi:hypothetical protein
MSNFKDQMPNEGFGAILYIMAISSHRCVALFTCGNVAAEQKNTTW